MLAFLHHYSLNRYTAFDSALLLGATLAVFFPRFADHAIRPLEKFGVRFARRKRLAILSVAAAVVFVRVGLLPTSPIPIPHIDDEFSYLLAGDTFAHGRLTNPPHPMWLYLDTVHVNQTPTYMSKYPPAQGAILAIGEILGNPWFGVILSVSGMCAAVLWMLQGWLPPAWALLGALLLLLRLGISSYWINSYWGGAVAAIGGALVVGSLPRILRRYRPRDSLTLGIGTAILVNSRPFEGLFFCLPVIAVILVCLSRKSGPAWRVGLRRVIAPFCLVMSLTAVFVGYYNWRGTGNALLTPYVLNERTYWSAPTFIWQKERPPIHFLVPEFNDFYNIKAHDDWLQNRPDTLAKFWRRLSGTFKQVLRFFVWPELCLPLLALPWVLRTHRARFLFTQIIVCLFASFLVPWFFPHYVAPMTASIFATLVQGTRYLRLWNLRGHPVGVGLSRLIVVSAVIPLLVHIQTYVTIEPPTGFEYRAKMEAQLNDLPGKHLVIVYEPGCEKLHGDWIHNAADIDGSKIVWARYIPNIAMDPLFEYFRGRRIWLAEREATPPRLVPYSDILVKNCGCN